MNEREMTDLLERAAGTLHPDVDGIVARGTARGRAVRRRRRVVGGSVSAILVGTVFAVANQAHLGGTDHGAGFASGSPTAAATKDATTPSPTQSPTSSATKVPHRRPIAASGLPATFAAIEPGDVETLSSVDRAGTSIGSGPLADFRWRGFAARVYVGIADLPNGTPTERCTLAALGDCVTQPDGTVVTTMQWTGPKIDGAVTGRTAVAFTTDGWEVGIQVFNAADSKESPILAPHPPVSLNALAQAATSDVWFQQPRAATG